MRALIALPLSFTLAFHSIALAKSPKAAPQTDATTEMTGLNGTNVAFMMAATCGENEWKKFAPWAKKKNFFKVEFAKTPTVAVQKDAVEVVTDKTFAAKMTAKGEVELNFDDKKFVGADACAVVMKAFDKPATKSALLSLALPKAHAQIFQEEGKDADAAQMVGAGTVAVLAAVIFKKAPSPVLRAAAGIVGAIALYWSVKSGVSAKSKDMLDDVMNSIVSFTCNKAAVFIKTPRHRVTIRKIPPPASVEVFDVKTEAQVPFLNASFATKSRETLVNIANRCSTTEDAEKIAKEYAQLRDMAAGKLAAAEEGRTEKVEAPAEPGQRAPQNTEDEEDEDDY